MSLRVRRHLSGHARREQLNKCFEQNIAARAGSRNQSSNTAAYRTELSRPLRTKQLRLFQNCLRRLFLFIRRITVFAENPERGHSLLLTQVQFGL